MRTTTSKLALRKHILEKKKISHTADKASSEVHGSTEGAKLHFKTRFSSIDTCVSLSFLLQSAFWVCSLGGELNVLPTARKDHVC